MPNFYFYLVAQGFHLASSLVLLITVSQHLDVSQLSLFTVFLTFYSIVNNFSTNGVEPLIYKRSHFGVKIFNKIGCRMRSFYIFYSLFIVLCLLILFYYLNDNSTEVFLMSLVLLMQPMISILSPISRLMKYEKTTIFLIYFVKIYFSIILVNIYSLFYNVDLIIIISTLIFSHIIVVSILYIILNRVSETFFNFNACVHKNKTFSSAAYVFIASLVPLLYFLLIQVDYFSVLILDSNEVNIVTYKFASLVSFLFLTPLSLLIVMVAPKLNSMLINKDFTFLVAYTRYMAFIALSVYIFYFFYGQSIIQYFMPEFSYDIYIISLILSFSSIVSIMCGINVYSAIILGHTSFLIKLFSSSVIILFFLIFAVSVDHFSLIKVALLSSSYIIFLNITISYKILRVNKIDLTVIGKTYL